MLSPSLPFPDLTCGIQSLEQQQLCTPYVGQDGTTSGRNGPRLCRWHGSRALMHWRYQAARRAVCDQLPAFYSIADIML